MVVCGDKRRATDYIEGLNMLASMRLCANVPGQYAIQTALGGYQSIDDLVAEGEAPAPPARRGAPAHHRHPGSELREAAGGALHVPAAGPKIYPIEDDQAFIAELLEAERVLLVQGSGFNWPEPDHFRLVFLPHEDDLRDAIGRLARFLEGYRKRHGT